jgi:hypothetical protein
MMFSHRLKAKRTGDEIDETVCSFIKLVSFTYRSLISFSFQVFFKVFKFTYLFFFFLFSLFRIIIIIIIIIIMVSKTFEFLFTPEEVAQRTVVENGALRFFKTTDEAVEGKMPYSALLKVKIPPLLPKPSSFSVVDPFRDSAIEGIARCYVKCGHNVRMPLTYNKADLQQERELKFSLVVKCDTCLGRESAGATVVPPPTATAAAPAAAVPDVAVPAPAAAAAADPAPAAAANAQPFLVTATSPPNALNPIFEDVAHRVGLALSRMHAICSVAPDPVQFFGQFKNELGQTILQEYERATASVPIPNLGNHSRRIRSPRVSLSPTFSAGNTPSPQRRCSVQSTPSPVVNALQLVMDSRAKRIEEQKRAVEEKKRADEEKKRAAEEKKRAAEEKKRAAEEKKRVAEEKKRAAEEKKNAGPKAKKPRKK